MAFQSRLIHMVLSVLLAGLQLCSAEMPVFTRSGSEDACICTDPTKGEGSCYEPVCPMGYYRCCATCKEAPCYGLTEMRLSYRGIKECIQCAPGDFCGGCDTFVKCPPNTREGREGPRVSPAGSTRVADCVSCAAGQEATFDSEMCMDKHADVCNDAYVRRCLSNCEAEDVQRGKNLTPCERLKCQVYCAHSWSSSCGSILTKHCETLTSPPEEEGAGLISEQVTITGCNVDCSGALQVRATTMALVVMFVAACRELIA